MRWLAFLLLALIHADVSAESPEVFLPIDRLRQQCGFDIPEAVFDAAVANVSVVPGYSWYSLRLELKSEKKDPSRSQGALIFVCSEEGIESALTRIRREMRERQGYEDDRITGNPASWSIRQSESGGRYYSHIAWEALVQGKNWKGGMAYSDYLFGDRTKISRKFVKICDELAARPCFEWRFDDAYKVDRRTLGYVQKIVREISQF